MSSTAVVTLEKMMESLPDTVQEQVVEHLREYIAALQDELQWDTTFKKTQPQLLAAARRAKQEIAAGRRPRYRAPKSRLVLGSQAVLTKVHIANPRGGSRLSAAPLGSIIAFVRIETRLVKRTT